MEKITQKMKDKQKMRPLGDKHDDLEDDLQKITRNWRNGGFLPRLIILISLVIVKKFNDEQKINNASIICCISLIDAWKERQSARNPYVSRLFRNTAKGRISDTASGITESCDGSIIRPACELVLHGLRKGVTLDD